MIPLSDENPTRRTAWMTLALIVASVGLFAYEWSLSPTQLQSFFGTWGLVPARFLADPADPAQLATLISSAFIHAGPIHLAGNMLYLWIFGNNVEDLLGPWRFGLFYMACALAAAAAQMAVGPDASAPVVGASGAVAGVLGAYALLFPRARVVVLVPLIFYFELARVPALLVIGFWFLLQLASGLASLGVDVASGGVAWFAHIGGFAAGVVLALPMLRKRRRAWR